jgi:signal transduction histidine kinase
MHAHGSEEQQRCDERARKADVHGTPAVVTPRRFSLVAALVLVLVLLATAMTLVNGALRIGVPFPGFLVAENRTVFSIGRPGWSIEALSRAFFSQVIAVDGRPITHPDEIQAAAAAHPLGTAIAYRFRKGADIFAAGVATQTFSAGDFFAVYGTYAIVGLGYALTGFVAVWRRRVASRVSPAVVAFFVLCQCVGAALGTAGDVYGPYRLVPLYFATQCLTFGALVHLAMSYPQPLGIGTRWRRVVIAPPYVLSLAVATGLVGSGDDVSLFVPLLYVAYLLIANGIFLYLAALVSGLAPSETAPERRGLRRALAGVLAVVLVPAMILLVYPILEQSISPLVLVGPLVLFPLLTASALPRDLDESATSGGRSVRLRLSLLFLGAVETSFLIAVAVFWQNVSWAQIVDDVRLTQYQRAAVEQLILDPDELAGESGATLERLASTVDESTLASAAVAAARRGEFDVVRAELRQLARLFDAADQRIEARRALIGGLAIPVLAILLGIAVLQAVTFAVAVRRWMIGPLDRIGEATSVIATGDLAHRLEPESTEEFSRLGSAVNVMAASLQAIQRRVELARVARQRAAGAARDAERRRLARELHDGVLQDLSAVRLRLNAPGAGADDGASRAGDAIARVIASIRSVVDDLRPPALSGTSLADAIAAHARVLAFAQSVKLDLDLSGATLVPDWAVRDLYRIAQEAIGNALRHAGATQVAVRIVPSGGDVLLEIVDDGVGFDPSAVTLGSGVHGMRERAAVLGGDLEIDRSALGGTRIGFLLRLLPSPGVSADAPSADT